MSANLQQAVTVALDMNSKIIPVVFVRDGEVFASSRDVAAFFEKNHRDVMRAIDTLLAHEPSWGMRSFTQGVYTLPETRSQQHRYYDMTRDGFTLLAMGFNGAKALKWKLKYIEAFNVMEAELRNKPTVNLSDPTFLRNMLLTYTEKVIALEGHVATLTPKADALDRIATADGSLGLIEAAKALQIQPKAFVRYLSMNGWIYRRAGGKNWLGYQARTAAGDIEHKVHTAPTRDGTEVIHEQVKITPRGLTKLAKIIPHAGVSQGAIQ